MSKKQILTLGCILMGIGIALVAAFIVAENERAMDGKVVFIMNEKLEFMSYADIEIHTEGVDTMINIVGNGIQVIGPCTIRIMEQSDTKMVSQIRFYHNDELMPISKEWKSFQLIIAQHMSPFIGVPKKDVDKAEDKNSIPFVSITNAYDVEFYMDGEKL